MVGGHNGGGWWQRERRRYERSTGERNSRWLPLLPARIWVGGGGCVVLVPDGAEVDEAVEREKKGRNSAGSRKGGRSWFLADFGPDFLHVWPMKSTPIYRGWKRVILSSLEKNYTPD